MVGHCSIQWDTMLNYFFHEVQYIYFTNLPKWKYIYDDLAFYFRKMGSSFCKLIEAKPLPANSERERRQPLWQKMVVFCKRVLGSWK
jgi:hypothetical protein